MPPNSRVSATPPPMGWCSGEQSFNAQPLDQNGQPIGEPIIASMVVQLVPMALLLLGMGVATTEDRRIPELRRAVPLTWVARLPRLTLAVDPLEALGAESLDKFAQYACQAFTSAIGMSTTPEEKEAPALGIA